MDSRWCTCSTTPRASSFCRSNSFSLVKRPSAGKDFRTAALKADDTVPGLDLSRSKLAVLERSKLAVLESFPTKNRNAESTRFLLCAFELHSRVVRRVVTSFDARLGGC